MDSKIQWSFPIPRHFQFRLRVARGSGTKIPRKKKLFWVRGPNDAMEYVAELLGIGRINREAFRDAGVVFIKKITEKKGPYEKGQIIYP